MKEEKCRREMSTGSWAISRKAERKRKNTGNKKRNRAEGPILVEYLSFMVPITDTNTTTTTTTITTSRRT